MKKIQIKSLTLPDPASVYQEQRKYCLFLGNDARRSFTNKKDAYAFLAYVNKELTRWLFLLNESFIEVFTWYRRSWFYLDHHPGALSIEIKITDISKFFNLTVDRSFYTNGNSFTFKNMNKAIEIMIEIVEELQSMYRSRNGWAEIQILEVLCGKLENAKEEIGKIGKDQITL